VPTIAVVVRFWKYFLSKALLTQADRHYDARLCGFQREQGLTERDWSERTRGPRSMTGRHVLRDVLGELGFELR
jgi:hypothetical protein